MISLRKVLHHDLIDDRERIAGWLAKLEGDSFGENTTQQILDFVRGNQWTLMYYCEDGNPIGLVVYVTVTYPNHRTCIIIGAAGASASAWLEASEVLVELAKSLDCSKLEAKGRPGWSRVFKAMGWKEKYRTIGIDVVL